MNYAALRKTASGLIKSNGFLMTARRSTPGEYDETLGESAAPVVQEWPIYGIKASLGKLTKYAEFSTRRQSMIQSGAIMLILEALPDYVPSIGDQIFLPGLGGGNATWWTVLDADGLDPGGIDTMFNVLVRV